MNIGIVTTWFERGAAYVSRQFRDVLKNYHTVYIYARGGETYAKDDPKWDNEHVTWGKKNYEATTAVDLKDFQKWIEKYNIDTVFFNEQKWWDVLLLCNKMGITHGAYIDYYTEELIPMLGVHDFLICNTKRHYSAFSWHPQCYYVPWGTDVNIFKPEKTDVVNSDMVTFFHSCGMSPDRKGTDLLIKAFYQLNSFQHAKLVIHTQVDLHQKLPTLYSIIKKLETNGALEIVHKTVPAPGLYYLGDIYVYPTRLEGIGLTIAEAISSGLVPLVPDNPPMNEFVPDDAKYKIEIERLYSRKDGYYWPKCDVSVDDLTLKMEWYIKNISEVPELKKEARIFAEDYLNWDENSKKIVDIFETVKPLKNNHKEKAEELIKEYKSKRLSRFKKYIFKIPFARKILIGR